MFQMQPNYGKWQPLIDLFLETNSQINLSAIRTPDGVYHKHILDALEISKMFDFSPGETMLDVGTGGGFPLLPLAIEYPALMCYGLDATQKKCRAVQAMADALGLKNLQTIRGRAEDHKGSYDLVTSRAVAYAEKLFPWTVSFVKSGGFLVRWKMESQEEESYIIEQHKKYKLELEAIHRYHLENDELQRVLYVFRKK